MLRWQYFLGRIGAFREPQWGRRKQTKWRNVSYSLEKLTSIIHGSPSNFRGWSCSIWWCGIKSAVPLCSPPWKQERDDFKWNLTSAQSHISQLIDLDHKVRMATAQSCWVPIKTMVLFFHIQTAINEAPGSETASLSSALQVQTSATWRFLKCHCHMLLW